MKDLDYKYIIILIATMIMIGLSYSSKDAVINGIGNFTSLNYVSTILGIIALSIETVNYLKFNKLNLNANLSFAEFNNWIEKLIRILLIPFAIAVSYSLLRGVLRQFFFKEIYFANFDNLELLFIAIVSIYLFIVSSLKLGKQFKEIIGKKGKNLTND